ncbi:MAG: PaaI family thioesterase [Methanomassiliicoccaceae archaeon]|jgi:acyl-CoA thioesterase|nr:PaaI family thioesterase [Methanomassiliicoccaceae archaeon]
MNDDEIRNVMDPSLPDHIFEVIKSVHNAPYSRLNKVDPISIRPDEVWCRMPLDESTLNSIGLTHGAAIFALADCTFAFAANLHGEKQIALSGSIIYHRPGVGNELTACTSKISDTNSVSTYEVRVYCGGKHIATATFVGFKLKDKKA